MQTMQILHKLIHSLKLQPQIAQTIPWEDIRLCIVSEFECCSSIYPDSQFQRIDQLIAGLAKEAERASEADVCTINDILGKMVLALQFLPEADHIDSLLHQANFDHACLNHYKDNTIIVLGDSHVNFFSGNETLAFVPIGHEINTCIQNTPYPFTTLHAGPCLAYHCNQPGTTFRFREKADYLCRNFIRPHAKIVCCLGEIDLRVHVFRQTVLQERPYEQIVDDILLAYLSFLVGLQKQGYAVYCWAPIASQTDSCPLDTMFPRNGTEICRNQATAYFNRRLEALCRENSIVFLSIFDQMITDDYRTIEQYLSSDRCHLGQSALPLAVREWKDKKLL